MPSNYQALVVQSFGGPEGPDDVMPFLRNVTAKRNVPDERLITVAEQYEQFGGVSPLNQQCRELVAAIQDQLKGSEFDVPVYWGNRNWEPYITDTAQQMVDDGIENALVFTTSAFSSYSGCRQYREDLEAAEAAAGHRVKLQKLRLYYNHPKFIETWVEHIRKATSQLEGFQLVFTAHSIPESMAAVSEYTSQLNEAASLICERLEIDDYDLVFQSRSGPPQIPWLEPDINDYIENLEAEVTLVVVPLGFTSDHMEVMFDLDTQAQQTARNRGINMVRVPTVGSHPRIIEMIMDLIQEQTVGAERLCLGAQGPWPDMCPEGHCLVMAKERPVVKSVES